MRLRVLENGHSPIQKFQMFFISRMMGFVPGPISLLSYRKSFFGKGFSLYIHEVLRFSKHWTLAELEMFGAFISKSNSCHTCASDHKAVAANAMDVETLTAVLDDYKTAPVSDKIKAVLGFLEKLSLQPDLLSKEDILELKSHGLSHEAIEEAAHVVAVFAIINRLADSFDFKMAPNAGKVGRFLFKNGYKKACLAG